MPFRVDKILSAVRKLDDWYSKRQLQKLAPDLLAELNVYLAQSQSTGCEFSDYKELYTSIRKLKPKEVLECGTGVSTLVIANALSKNAADGFAGRLTSMEEIPIYYEQSKQLLPKKYAPYVDFVLSPRIDFLIGIFRGVRYKELPGRDYEFVFVDGPDFRSPSDGAATFNADFIHVLQTSKAASVSGLIDQRLSSVFVLQRLLGKRSVRYSALRHLSRLGPVKCSDIKLIDTKHPAKSFYLRPDEFIDFRY